jgi:carbamoylphosphate synthase large subunit
VKLQTSEVFKKYNVEVLGTPPDSIIATEDRQLFTSTLMDIEEHVAPRQAAFSVQEVKTSSMVNAFLHMASN